MADILTAVTISDEIVRLGLVSKPCEQQPSIREEQIPVAESISQEDLENAKQSGYSHGFSEGFAEAEAKLASEFSHVKALIESIPAAIQESRLQLSDEIADIILLIIKQFFINQQQNKDSIALQINQLLNQLNDKQNIELSVHPKDLTLLQQGKLKIDAKACKNLRIVPDDNLRLGGCVVKSEHGVFDASIERQIDNLKQVLLQMKLGERFD